MSRRFSPTAWLAALALLALSMMSAPARSAPPDRVYTSNCYGARNMVSCVHTRRRGPFNPYVISVAGPQTPEEREAAREAAEARDRRWVERCQPVIRQDRHGMPRYSYGAAGCEYGVLD